MPARGTNVSVGMAARIWRRDKGMCAYCGGAGGEVDHVVPRKYGGPTTPANLVISCRSCNHKKKGRLDMDWTTRGISALIAAGEDTSWMDDFHPRPYA